jgi:hypothetical protein
LVVRMSHHRHAAVDGEHLAGDAGGLVRGEENHRGGHLVGRSGSAQGNLANDGVVPRDPPVTRADLPVSSGIGSSSLDCGRTADAARLPSFESSGRFDGGRRLAGKDPLEVRRERVDRVEVARGDADLLGADAGSASRLGGVPGPLEGDGRGG